MTPTNKRGIVIDVGVVAGVIVAVILALMLSTQYASGAPAPRDENQVPAVLGASCTPGATRFVTIGHQAQTTVFSTSTARAWASIQVPANATNTVALALGGTATLGQGYQLVPTSASGTGGTTTPSIQLGLKTDLPYTGIVTALTNNGTTTVLVIECNF